MTLNSIEDVKSAHDGHFFTPSTMRYWHSRVHGKVYPIPGYGAFFTTSDRSYDGLRVYTLRFCTEDGSIFTVGSGFDWDTRHHVMAGAKAAQARVLEYLRNINPVAIAQG